MTTNAVSSKSTLGYDPKQDTTYMSPEMVTYFKKHLEEILQQLIMKEHLLSQTLMEASHQESDFMDRSAQEGLQDEDVAIQEQETQMRHGVEDALRRLEEGTYGYCELTGEPIGVKRLLLVPTARYSVKAQEMIEKENKS
ncbi:MAG: TraR/DksA family transcriptional regulator [Alphaproteobacteria bacterium]|nr:TraR/DksA family transcriptional regulator [Alphaproteobacteria bacterium]